MYPKLTALRYSQHTGTMNKQILIDSVNFKVMEPKIAMLEKMSALGAQVLPLIDTVAKTTTTGTYISHHKFSVSLMGPMWDRMDETMSLKLAMSCLQHGYDVPADMMTGRVSTWKTGAYSFQNEYDTTIRIWSTKRVGSRLIFEVSVVGYKGGVPVPSRCSAPCH